jgi:hypothetical protein
MKEHIYIILVLLNLISSFGFAQVAVLDNFNDGNYTSGPAWTLNSGAADASTNSLVFGGGSNGVSISTPLTADCEAWSFTLRSNNTSNDDNVRFYFVLINNATPSNALADGYCVDYDGSSGDFILYRLDNGTLTSLGSSNETASSSTRTVTITMNASGNITVNVSGLGTIISVTSTNYSAANSEFIAITCNTDDSDASYTFTVDDITYTPACNNPTSAGVIAGVENLCGSYDPSNITSSSNASGQNGTLEYKWQLSTTSSTSGFIDIASSNSTTYDPPSTISQTTWYKRLARVSCKVDWIGAAESNVVEKKVANSQLDRTPLADTAFSPGGSAAFGVSPLIVYGTSYQWQVSSDNGVTWANVVSSSVYSGVNDTLLIVNNPTTALNNNLYRCVLSNTPCSQTTSSPALLTVIQSAIFSNTTTTSCGTDLGNLFSFQRTVAVSGLPTPLGTGSGQYVLRQVRIVMGSSTCIGDLRTYSARIKSPSGSTIQLFSGFTTSTTNMWADVTYRDHSSLERVKDYSNAVQSSYFPYKIGYYKLETGNSFNLVNGQNPNGNWILELAENTDLTNDGGVDDEVSFQRIELVFGPSFVYSDISSSSSNNDCSGAVCLGTQEIIIGTNNAYSQSDPNYPGSPVSSCSWNGANNNSAWFSFTPIASSARLTISGMNDGGSSDLQPIVLQAPLSCSTPTIVPTGGCPDDESTNNRSYLSTNGGGTSSGAVYSSGITANCEFNLAGLTPNQKYFLYVDGTGGASSNFYIEVDNNCKPCNTLLPVKFTNQKASCNGKGIMISWSTESEINNDYFVIEKSIDKESFNTIATIKGAGNSKNSLKYSYNDFSITNQSEVYYRIKQVDFDGASAYSDLMYANCKELIKPGFYPNPFTNSIQLTNLNESNLTVNIFSPDSRLVKTLINIDRNALISIDNLSPGLYFFQIVGSNNEIIYNFHALKSGLD